VNITYKRADGIICVAQRLGGEWSIEPTVPAGGPTCQLTCDSFGSDGLSFAWYMGSPIMFNQLAVATKVADAWQIQIYDPMVDTPNPIGLSLALDDRGSPWISYSGGGGGMLRVAHRQPFGKWIEAPPETFQTGFTWFSIPWDSPLTTEVSRVLGFDATNKVYRWNPVAKNIELYSDDFRNLDPGRGYQMWLGSGNPLVGYWAEPGVSTVDIPAPGITWVGVPCIDDLWQGDIVIYNKALGEFRTIEEDATAHPGDSWINPNWVTWDNQLRTYTICTFDGTGDDRFVHPWMQYQVWSNVGELMLFYPE
jgi:hypothetical protein